MLKPPVFFLFALMILTGCSEDIRDARDAFPLSQQQLEQIDRDREAEQNPDVPFDDSFSTQITNQLFVSGSKCVGNERLQVNSTENPATFLCRRDQWLVTVDDVNVCDNPDSCDRTTPVSPFIANLRKQPGNFRSGVEVFLIVPVSPVTNAVKDVTDTYWVRFDRTRTPEVVRKDVTVITP
jgi:hypothetical protein